MRAQGSDPWVSVSLLGEALFCDRAGRFQYEASQDDTGEESDIDPPRRGWYRRPFSVADIERELRTLGRRVLLRVGLALAAIVANVVFTTSEINLPSVGLAIAALLVVVSLLRASFAWLALQFLLQDARRAATGEPPPGLRQPQEVEWWSLLRAGFECHRYEDPLSDKDWRLAGKPWRVLQRGSVRVPVFRKKNEDKTLYPQHYARIAAYAHLISRGEGAEVPYGVILLGSSYRGLAVPVHPGNQKQFHDALINARRIVASGDDQPAPRNTNRCRSCPWGKPMGVDRGQSYESPCGTRYGWVPPHQKAVRKGLI